MIPKFSMLLKIGLLGFLFCGSFTLGQDFGLGSFGDSSDPLTVTSWFELKEGSRDGRLFVKAEMSPGFHIYGQNHKGVEIPTSFKAANTELYRVGNKFVPDHEPHVSQKNGAHYEEFEPEVTWSVPIRLAESADPATTKVKVKFRGMVCNERGCRPPKH